MRRSPGVAWRGAGGVLLLGATLLLACSSGSTPRSRAERKPMALSIELRVVPDEIVFQESASCDFTLVNGGGAPVQVVHPGRVQNLPYVTLVDRKSGKSLVFERPAEGWVPPTPEPLAPGGKLHWSVDLLTHADIPAPGDYEVSLRYPFDTDQMAESDRVPLHVAPSTARQPAIAGVAGVTGPIQSAVWVNVAARPPRLVRGTFTLSGADPKIGQVRSLDELPADARPELSVPAAGTVSRDHWIAWLEDGRLRATHYGEGHRPMPALEIALPGTGPAMLVGPLRTDALVDPATPPAGSALVWSENGGSPRLTEVVLGPGKLSLGNSVPMPGPRPLWIRSLTRSSGKRIVVSLQDEAGRLVLRWRHGVEDAGGELPHAEWSGTLLAAAAVVTPQDAVHGALMFRTPPGADGRQGDLRVIQWELNAADEGREVRRDSLVATVATAVSSADLEVSSRMAAAVLRGPRGARYFWRSGAGATEIPPEMARGDGPLLPAFRTDSDVLLLHARDALGWEVLHTDGSPIEPGHAHGAGVNR